MTPTDPIVTDAEDEPGPPDDNDGTGYPEPENFARGGVIRGDVPYWVGNGDPEFFIPASGRDGGAHVA